MDGRNGGPWGKFPSGGIRGKSPPPCGGTPDLAMNQEHPISFYHEHYIKSIDLWALHDSCFCVNKM